MTTKDTRKKEYSAKITPEVENEVTAVLIEGLLQKGAVRLTHFGVFKIITVPAKKRFDFKTRKIVPTKPHKRITFSPAEALSEMLNKKAKAG